MPTANSAPIADPAKKPATGRSLAQWWLICAFWLLIALASALEMSLVYSTGIEESVRFALLYWLPWSLLTPLIMWISATYTLGRTTWRRAIWVHLATCVLVVGGLGVLGYWGGPPPFTRQLSAQGQPSLRDSKPAAFVILRRATSQLPTFWAVVGIAHALWFYQRAKERARREAELESRLTQARLQALRMQLNPHFLFNTLNSIAALVHEDPHAADEMIGLLSELLRLTLHASDQQEVALREELHFLERYLAIEKARFGGRLRVEKQIDSAAMDAVVPILILQPLVENAIKHGIETQLAQGLISITVKRRGDNLQVQVSDNGRGLSNGDGKLKEGVGLGNTRSRLKVLYGEKGALKLVPREGGFSAEIEIPWRKSSDSPAVEAT